MTLLKLEDYGNSFQLKVIHNLIHDRGFLLTVSDVLSPEYFSSQAHKWIVGEIMGYFKKYNSLITVDYLKVELQKLENDVLEESIKEQLVKIISQQDDDFKYIQDEFSTFCKNQKLKLALLESVDLIKVNAFEDIRKVIDDALKAGQDKNIGHQYDIDIEERYATDYRNPIETPWPEINDLLQGGLGEGDLGLIYGNPGGGKSWLAMAIAAHAVKLGKTVFFYTLELGEKYVGRRFDSVFTEINVNEVENNKETIIETLEGLEGKLVIKEYPMKGASLDTIKAHISKSESLGLKPDMIIVDYLDLLRSTTNGMGGKEELDDIYREAKGLAKEYGVPLWSPSQVNRAGARDNIIEGDKSAGSYDKIMIADFVLSLSRKKEDKIGGTGRFHVMKSRFGGDGMSFFVSADTSRGKFEILEDYDENNEEHNPKYSKQEEDDYQNLGIDKRQKNILAKKFFELEREMK